MSTPIRELVLLRNQLIRLVRVASENDGATLCAELPLVGTTISVHQDFASSLAGDDITIVVNGRTTSGTRGGKVLRHVCVGFTAYDRRKLGDESSTFTVSVTWEISIPDEAWIDPDAVEVRCQHDDRRPESRSDSSLDALDERLRFIQEKLLRAACGRKAQS